MSVSLLLLNSGSPEAPQEISRSHGGFKLDMKELVEKIKPVVKNALNNMERLGECEILSLLLH
jgi:hypothetical protein